MKYIIMNVSNTYICLIPPPLSFVYIKPRPNSVWPIYMTVVHTATLTHFSDILGEVPSLYTSTDSHFTKVVNNYRFK